MEIKCKRCGYSWNTKSSLYKISCPNCGDKNKNPEIDTSVFKTRREQEMDKERNKIN